MLPAVAIISLVPLRVPLQHVLDFLQRLPGPLAVALVLFPLLSGSPLDSL
jgi:hypothetical protein